MDVQRISEPAANTMIYTGSGLTMFSGLKNWLTQPGNIELANFGFMALGAIIAVVGLYFNIKAAKERAALRGDCAHRHDCPLNRRKS